MSVYLFASEIFSLKELAIVYFFKQLPAPADVQTVNSNLLCNILRLEVQRPAIYFVRINVKDKPINGMIKVVVRNGKLN